MFAEEFDVKLLVGDGGGVGEVNAVGEIGFAVVFRGFVEEASSHGFFECGEIHLSGFVLRYFFFGEVFFDAGEFVFRESAIGIEISLELGKVDPGSDGGLKEFDVFAVAVGVVAEVGVAGFDKDDGFESYFAKDGGEEDACVNAVGLSSGKDFVEESDMLDIGARRWVGGAGDGGVGDAMVESVVPDGEDLVAYGLRAAGLVASEA